MASILRTGASLLLCLGCASNALAQSYCPDGTQLTPCIQAKQDNPYRVYQISIYGPAVCDDEILRAGNSWYYANSAFSPLQDAVYYEGQYRVAGTPQYQILFNTAAEMGIYGSDNGVTFYGSSTGTYTRPDGVRVPLVNDADTVLNYDKWANGVLECDDATYLKADGVTTTKYDLARTMAHEMGHWAGFNHNTDTRCATYKTAQYKVWGTLCSAETTTVNTTYGPGTRM